MTERPESNWGIRIIPEGPRKLRIHRNGVDVIFDESAAPRGGVDRGPLTSFIFPMGTIESLKPLLKDVYNATGAERDESFWLDIDDEVVMTPAEAYKKIRKTNKDSKNKIKFEDIASAVLATDKELYSAKAYGDITEIQINSLISQLAGSIRNEYKKSPPKRKA